MSDDNYYNEKHVFIKDNTLYVLGNFNQDISNNVIPEMNDIINNLSCLKNPEFEIIINSPGGYTYELFSLLYYLDIMKQSGIKIITRVIGEACSCASMLACYGDERYMYKYGVHLMHLGTYNMGNTQNFTDSERLFEGSKNHFDKIMDIYLKHTKLKRKELEKFLAHDYFYINAEKCLEYGLCDYII